MQRLPWLFRVRSNEKVICGVIGFAIFTDLFLYGLVVPILPYALTPRFGIPETKVQSSTSTLLAVYAAGLLVSCPFVGWFADWTTSRRLPLLLGLFALVGSTLIFTLGRSFSLLVVARVLQGISAAVVWTVGLALLVDTVGMDRLGVAMGVVSIFMSVGIALGPVLGGIIYEVGGYYAPFYLAFAFLTLDIFLRLVIIEKKTALAYLAACSDEVVPTIDRQELVLSAPLGESRGRLRMPPIFGLLRSARLLTGCWIGFVGAVILSSFDAVLPLELKDAWHYSVLASSLIYGALVLPSFLVGPAAGWYVDTRGTKPVCALALLLELPALVCLRFPDGATTTGRPGQLAALCLLLALNGVGSAMLLTGSMTDVALVVDGTVLAQAYALFNMSFSAGTLVGPLVAGAIREARGWATMAWSLALFAVVSLPACLAYTGGRFRETYWLRARPTVRSGSGDEEEEEQVEDETIRPSAIKE